MSKNKNLVDIKLNKEEKSIEKALERGEFKSARNLNRLKKLFKQAAENYTHLQKSKRITIRLNQEDLFKVKIKAKQNKIPYQTLLGVLVHQYAEGQTQIKI